MELVGVVGSVLQIAQVGAQLSLNFYKIAQSVGSANREVQYFAKDIALFSTVLKDLGNALSKGQTSKIYREDAYQTGVGIARDCEEVFEEIQDILNKLNKNGGTAPASMIFRKSRVQLLRGRLESLKSKILLQVGVLSYAENFSASSNSTDDINGLLALKSLVLANETTEAAFQELFTKSTEGSSLVNPISISDQPKSRVPKSSATSGHQSSATATPAFSSIAEILHKSEPAFPPSHTTKESPVLGKKPSISTYLLPPSRRRTYAEVWSTVDRLELALRKVETAEWEHERLQKILASNVKIETSSRADWTEREKTYLSKFKNSLLRFGLKKEKIDQAITSIMTYHPSAGMRTEVDQVVSQNEVLFATLNHFGVSWQNDKNNPDFRIVKRWIPDYLEDILWEKIYQTFEAATDRQPGSYISIADSVISNDSDEQSLAQKHQAIQQAINQVNQYNMAIESLDDTQSLRHTQPVARQSESRQSHLTVPANVAMPRRASMAMNPPPKSSLSSPLERRIFDTTPEARRPKVEMDGPRSIPERFSTSVASTVPPSFSITSEEDNPGHSDSFKLTANTHRSLDDPNSRRYAGVHPSLDRDDFSATKVTHGIEEHHQSDFSTRSNSSPFPSPSLKRKTLKEENTTTPSSTLQAPNKLRSQTSPLQGPRQWFESEKHDKSSQTVRDLLKRWTFLDLGDEDHDESPDEQQRVRDYNEDDARVKRVRIRADGAEEELLESRGHRRGGNSGNSGDGGERGTEQRKRVRNF